MLSSATFLTIIGYVFGTIVSLVVVYALVRILSSAIFRSWFLVKHNFDEKENKYGR